MLIEYVNAKEAYQIANSKEKKDKKSKEFLSPLSLSFLDS